MTHRVQRRPLQQAAHDGDPVLTAHVTSAAATLDEYGSWRVKKVKQSRKIDGLVASVIAFSRAARAPLGGDYIFDWRELDDEPEKSAANLRCGTVRDVLEETWKNV